MDLIKSVRSTDELREFFIKQGAKGKVFALEASPQLDAILTSKPVERNHLNKLVKFYQQHRPQAKASTRAAGSCGGRMGTRYMRKYACSAWTTR